MPRNNRIFKKRKSCCPKKVANVDSVPEQTKASVSSSEKKLADMSKEYSNFSNQQNSNEIVDLSKLVSAISDVARCRNCGSCVSIHVTKRIGLASQLEVFCVSCSNKSSCYNSEMHCNDTLFDINTRYVYALRCIGRGQAGGRTFCGVMNFPPPPAKFKCYIDVLAPASETVCKNTMTEAVEEAVEHNDNCRDISVALDGTWQKRGHMSQNGVMTATSVDTGKVIDCQIYSKYCRCSNRLNNIHEQTCIANYQGSSGGMEVAGAKEIFRRSLENYNVRYVEYLGDGDTKAFKEVVKEKPYGENCAISKLECVGHVQKRMTNRLNKLKAKNSNLKLADGKSLTGRNRLTKSAVADIQKYYGLAITRNTSNVVEMKKAVWAEFFHILSTNNEPQHGLCPEGLESWCKYRIAEASGLPYDHSDHFHIAPVVMEFIKPVFRDLANPDLLSKCVHGRTQNPNESVNNIIWSRLPKTMFLSLKPLTFGVYEAVSSFNKGNIVKCHILKAAGIEPGKNCVAEMMKLDKLRISVAKRKMLETEKKARQKRNKRKLQQEDAFLEAEGPDEPSYCAGNYS